MAALGPRWLTDALFAAMDEQRREDAWRVYTTDALSVIAQQLGAKLRRRYYDIIHPQPRDERDGDAVVRDVLFGMGIKVVS